MECEAANGSTRIEKFVREAFSQAVSAAPPTRVGLSGTGQLERFFGSRRWETIPLGEVKNWTDEIHEFTTEAVAYFLPAYLLAALREPSGGVASLLSDFLLPPKGGRLRASYGAWWHALTELQKRAVLMFIREFDSVHFKGVFSEDVLTMLAESNPDQNERHQ
ncbi:MAG: DUF6714 family protein [Pseudomonadota bacterium]|jgi:hypothetical protein